MNVLGWSHSKEEETRATTGRSIRIGGEKARRTGGLWSAIILPQVYHYTITSIPAGVYQLVSQEQCHLSQLSQK